MADKTAVLIRGIQIAQDTRYSQRTSSINLFFHLRLKTSTHRTVAAGTIILFEYGKFCLFSVPV